jgi:hypothetical protein
MSIGIQEFLIKHQTPHLMQKFPLAVSEKRFSLAGIAEKMQQEITETVW